MESEPPSPEPRFLCFDVYFLLRVPQEPMQCPTQSCPLSATLPCALTFLHPIPVPSGTGSAQLVMMLIINGTCWANNLAFQHFNMGNFLRHCFIPKTDQGERHPSGYLRGSPWHWHRPRLPSLHFYNRCAALLITLAGSYSIKLLTNWTQ